MKNIAGVLQGTVTPGQCHEIASLSPTERDRVINKLMGEATTGRFVVRGLDQQAKLFFFIPVVFTPNDRETSLIANFHGAKQVADALARSGLGQHQQSVRLIPKIFEHEEVAHWSTGDLQTMVHMIMTLDEDKIRRFPKRGSAADAHESTPILSYLVGAVFLSIANSPRLGCDGLVVRQCCRCQPSCVARWRKRITTIAYSFAADGVQGSAHRRHYFLRPVHPRVSAERKRR
ncbi:hypothetical protein ACFS07_33200 [Undibacterium arcticum]